MVTDKFNTTRGSDTRQRLQLTEMINYYRTVRMCKFWFLLYVTSPLRRDATEGREIKSKIVELRRECDRVYRRRCRNSVIRSRK